MNFSFGLFFFLLLLKFEIAHTTIILLGLLANLPKQNYFFVRDIKMKINKPSQHLLEVSIFGNDTPLRKTNIKHKSHSWP